MKIPNKDLYSILGVDQGASQENIRTVYLARIRILHPDRIDKNLQPKDWEQANLMLAELNDAYAVLKDQKSRKEYDAYKYPKASQWNSESTVRDERKKSSPPTSSSAQSRESKETTFFQMIFKFFCFIAAFIGVATGTYMCVWVNRWLGLPFTQDILPFGFDSKFVEWGKSWVGSKSFYVTYGYALSVGGIAYASLLPGKTQRTIKIVIGSIFGLLILFVSGSVFYFRNEINNLAKKSIQGDPQAQYELGVAFFNGNGVNKDEIRALQLFEESAEKNNLKAQYALGLMYLHGHGTPIDYQKGIYWLQAAADKDMPEAQFDLGDAYLNGQAGPNKEGEAIKWFEKSADQGYAPAEENLGTCYFGGKGVKKDFAESAKWVQVAANQGLETAQFKIGGYYGYGIGVKQNVAEQIKWWTKAANNPDVPTKFEKDDQAECQNELAKLYVDGKIVEKNYEEAFKLFSKSANSGNQAALYTLGYMYDRGYGTDENPEKAFNCWKQLAVNGNDWAQYGIARMYEYGRGIGKDKQLALYWYQQSAKLGNPQALKAVNDLSK